MKNFLVIIFLGLLLSGSVYANDISEFEIEGASIGDSGLIYATKKELDEKKKDWFKDKKYSISADIELNNLKQYDKLQFVYFANDKNYILHVNKNPYDVLLKTLPWSIANVQTIFMKYKIIVNWN